MRSKNNRLQEKIKYSIWNSRVDEAQLEKVKNAVESNGELKTKGNQD